MNGRPAQEPACAACLYFQVQEGISGNCHRYPPSYAGNASPRESHHWRYPVVHAHNWCGEYRMQAISLAGRARTPDAPETEG